MEYALAIVGVIAVILVLVFALRRKGPEQLTSGESPKAELPPAEPKKPNALAAKLEAKKEQQKSGQKELPPGPKAALPTVADAPAAKLRESKPADGASSEATAPEKSAEPSPQKAAEPAAGRSPEEQVSATPVGVLPASPISAPRPSAAHKRDVEGVRRGLGKARDAEGFFGKLSALVTGKKEIDPNLVGELEEVLLTSDVGVKTTARLLDQVKLVLSRGELSDPAKVWEVLRSEAKKILSVGGGGIVISSTPTVVMMVGVNGAGKTTTIGKIATKLTHDKRTVVLAAGDTFRAAAVQQLEVWGKRVGCEVVQGKDGADPAGVVFDSVQKGKAASADVVLVDTAGRLHTKTPLMDELKKIAKSVGKAAEGAPHETLLVIDATNGQNALAQARQFSEALPLSGIVLTKLDGTAKGGVILSICDELNLPVRYIGLGERPDDLHEFDADEYVEAVFGDFGRGSSAA